MITPIELQSKTFKSGIGYDKRDVDHFISEVLIGYETLYKENVELNDKINTLNEGLSYYKSIEKTLQKALVLAEQTAEETKEAARKQAKAIESEAHAKAQLIIADANNELNRLQQQIIQLLGQYESYKAQFKHLAAAQCELLDSDTFQIHISNLDLINNNEVKKETNKEINKEVNKENKKELNKVINEENNKEINKEYLKNTNPDLNKNKPYNGQTDVIAEKEKEKNEDEDFEFYNIYDEQE